MLTPDQKRVKFDPTFLEIVNTSLRHTTQGIQNDFATANIASTFIHSNCPICLKDQLSAIEITQMTCGHYSCNNCMLDYLNKNKGISINCFSCRSAFTELITITHGIEHIEDYLHHIQPPILSRHLTCGRSYNNCSGSYNMSIDNLRQLNHMKLIYITQNIN